MDDRGNQSGGESGDYVWLRYGTQLTANGRSYTIEMNIPMPIGASEEKREQLLREADAGMSQVANHVESRVAQLLQRGPSAQGKIPTPAPAIRSATQPRPASLPAPQTGPQPLQPAPARGRDNTPDAVISTASTQKEVVTVPPTRLNIGASMPSTPTTGDNNNNLSLQQFISYIRENMGLNPKQAMDLLKIKTLTGINLREALEQLQKIAGNESVSTLEIEQSANETVPTMSTAPVRQNSGALSAPSSGPLEMVRTSNSPIAERPRIVSEGEPLYAFDEEVEPGENHELEDDLEDFNFPREFTVQERGQARSKISNLRESRGPTQASQARLQALTNVIDTQISAEQLQELLEGVWNVQSMRKLKVDQVEVLISWAKEDDFVSEAEAVLAILEEE